MKKLITSLMASMLLFSIGTFKADAAGFVGFGDSNTEGKYFEKQYPNYLHKTWVKQTGATNAGVTGNTTNMAMKRFNAEVLAQKPTSVSIMFGQNDGLIVKKLVSHRSVKLSLKRILQAW
jgi:lysophospholipase L1-like esterase